MPPSLFLSSAACHPSKLHQNFKRSNHVLLYKDCGFVCSVPNVVSGISRALAMRTSRVPQGMRPTGMQPYGIRQRSVRSEEHTSELQSHVNLVCRLLLEKI